MTGTFKKHRFFTICAIAILCLAYLFGGQVSAMQPPDYPLYRIGSDSFLNASKPGILIDIPQSADHYSVFVINLSCAYAIDLDGVKVTENYPVFDLKKGDIITNAGGVEIKSSDEFEKIAKKYIGRTLVLTAKRRISDDLEIVFNTKCVPIMINSKDLSFGFNISDTADYVAVASFYSSDANITFCVGHDLSPYGIANSFSTNSSVYHFIQSSVLKYVKGVNPDPNGNNIPRVLGNYNDSKPIGSIVSIKPHYVSISFDNLQEVLDGKKLIDVTNPSEATTGYVTIVYNGILYDNFKVYDIDTTTGEFHIRSDNAVFLKNYGGIINGQSGTPVFQNGRLLGVISDAIASDQRKGLGYMAYYMIKDAIGCSEK